MTTSQTLSSCPQAQINGDSWSVHNNPLAFFKPEGEEAAELAKYAAAFCFSAVRSGSEPVTMHGNALFTFDRAALYVHAGCTEQDVQEEDEDSNEDWDQIRSCCDEAVPLLLHGAVQQVEPDVKEEVEDWEQIRSCCDEVVHALLQGAALVPSHATVHYDSDTHAYATTCGDSPACMSAQEWVGQGDEECYCFTHEQVKAWCEDACRLLLSRDQLWNTAEALI